MKRIKYKYRDALSNWEWRERECYVSSTQEQEYQKIFDKYKEKYCEDVGCEYQNFEYEIISVEEVEQ